VIRTTSKCPLYSHDTLLIIARSILDRSNARSYDEQSLIDVLTKVPEATGVALDISPGACAVAVKGAEKAGVADRLTVVQRSIESLADDPSPIAGADIIHSGFALHDLSSAAALTKRSISLSSR